MAQRTSRPTDSGFTLVEVLVALALISTLMASLGTYFVSSMRVSRAEAQSQAAVRIAQTGMEMARGYGGLTLLAGRAQCGSCLDVSAYDGGLTTKMVRFDAPVNGVAPLLSIPADPPTESEVVNGIRYWRYFFVGRCWVDAAGVCDTPVTAVPMLRVVVGVTWTQSGCPQVPNKGPLCIRSASALFSADPSDPLFTR